MQNLVAAKPGRRRPLLGEILSAFVLAAAHACCWGQAKSPDPEPPRRFALVIGNRTYARVAELPSVDVDVAQMDKSLHDLGFDVTRFDKVPSEDFLENTILPTFRTKIHEGDLVVFYFSGHGFSYGASSYLAPADLPTKVQKDDLSAHALPVESVEDYLGDSKPGLLLIIVDACRSIASFVVDDGGSANVANTPPTAAPAALASALAASAGISAGTIKKGFEPGEPPNGYTVETLIAYASKAGYEALATSEPDKASLFTRDLMAYIARPDTEFKEMYGMVSSDVDFDSGKAQRAGLAVWTATSLFMKQTSIILDQEKTAWLAALSTEDAKSISRFLQTHAVSAYAENARAWLRNNSAQQRLASSLSPQQVDSAWTSSSRTLSAPVDGLAYLAHGTAAPPGQFAPPIAVTTGADRSARIRSSLDSLVAAGSLVTTRALSAFAAPDSKAKPIQTLPAGTAIKISTDAERKSVDGKTWMEAKVAAGGASIFVPLQRLEAPKLVDLGVDLKEVVAPARTTGLVDLVQEKSIVDTVAELQAAGKKIRWVSLASGHTDDKVEGILRAGRLVHAAYVLKGAGIPTDRITSVADASDFFDSGVRVRFFGE